MARKSVSSERRRSPHQCNVPWPAGLVPLRRGSKSVVRPGNHLFGNGCRNAASPPGGTSLNAAGFVSFEAMPSLTLIFSFYPMALRIVSAISAGGSRRFAVRSK